MIAGDYGVDRWLHGANWHQVAELPWTEEPIDYDAELDTKDTMSIL